MALKLDGKEVERFDVKAGLSRRSGTYAHRVKAGAGSHRIALAIVGGSADSNEKQSHKEKSDSRKKSLLGVVNLEIDGPSDVGPKLPESYRRIVICVPAAESQDKPSGKQDSKAAAADRADCARRVLQHFANRAFRRPVKDAEVDRLMAIWREADAQKRRAV